MSKERHRVGGGRRFRSAPTIAGLLLLASVFVAGQRPEPRIEMVATASKAVYRVGESITFTYYLVNRGNRGVFVYRPTRINLFFYGHFGGVSLEIVEAESGRSAHYSAIFKHSGSGESLSPIPERVRGYYHFLPPMGLTGLIDEFDTKRAKLGPGVYEFRLGFGDHEPEKWPEGERSALPYPVFSGEVSSNPVRVTIVRK